MIAAGVPQLRRPGARLLHLDAAGTLTHAHRWQLTGLLHTGDLVIANDAATLPASFAAVHERTLETVEIRLAGRASLDPEDMQCFSAVLFGAGNFRTRTEHRPLPPTVRVGDRLAVGAIFAVVDAVLDHPRLVRLRFDAPSASVWRMMANHGRPIQYAHVHERLALWDVWTPIAAAPVAYEAPSASFALDWSTLEAFRHKGVEFRTLTHAAGISSTGDATLDERFPLDEPYFIPEETARAISQARERHKRVIAVGTTVVRAIEHAARNDGNVRWGAGLADQRIGPQTRLRVIDALLTGTHEAGTSHYEMLGAFTNDETLRRVTHALDAHEYLSHEFGDSMLIERDGLLEQLRTVAAARSAIPSKVPKQIDQARILG